MANSPCDVGQEGTLIAPSSRGHHDNIGIIPYYIYDVVEKLGDRKARRSEDHAIKSIVYYILLRHHCLTTPPVVPILAHLNV